MIPSDLLLLWLLLILSSVFFIIISPLAKNIQHFFKGSYGKNKTQPSFFILTTSLIISWIFAKSIVNAANLGMAYGIVGGLSYAMYYLSFLVAGIIIYQLRVKGHFKSIHDFIQTKFGHTAVILFSLIIGIRLFNEVWSNVAIIGSYFGEIGSTPYIISIFLFTILTLAYTMKGGMRSSLFTDMIQFIFFAFLLVFILGFIIPTQGFIGDFLTTGIWSFEMGLNLFFVALIQIFSYPFHDPVMTDRGFLTQPKRMLKSFITAGIVGFILITLFSFVGIYAQLNNLDSIISVAQSFGIIMLLLVNFIMVTSAASTLDSTFTSSTKLLIMDLDFFPKNIQLARIIMAGVAIIGLIPLLFSPEIISATTISGTMVLGLAPIFVLWFLKVPKISYYLSISIGILSGIILITGFIPEHWLFTSGKYADLLFINIISSIAVFAAYLIPWIVKKWNT